MRLDACFRLDGLTVHEKPWLVFGEAMLTGTAIYIDTIGYQRLMRGDDPEVALRDYTFRVLPAMGTGFPVSPELRASNVHDPTIRSTGPEAQGVHDLQEHEPTFVSATKP